MPTFNNADVEIGNEEMVNAICDDPELIFDAVAELSKKSKNPGNWQTWERIGNLIDGSLATGRNAGLDMISGWVAMYERMDHLDRERAMAELARVQS